jgi:hypothetical protein
MKVNSIIAIVAVLGLAVGAWAQEVKVDIYGGSNGTIDGTWTEWRPWNYNPETSHTTIDGIHCMFHTSHMDGGDAEPYWWWPYGGESGGDNLVSDGFYTESTSPGSPCWVYIGFDGLTVGVEYDFTAYMNIAGVGGSGASASITATGGASGGSGGGTGSVSVDAANIDAAGTVTWSWTATAGDAHFQIDYSGGRGDIAGYWLTPEPATVALLGLGSLVLIRKRRRA